MLLTMILVLMRLSSLEARPAGDTKAFDQINSPNVVCQTRILAPFTKPLVRRSQPFRTRRPKRSVSDAAG